MSIELPIKMIENKKLNLKDLLIYLNVKKYINNNTRSCYPSINTIIKDSGVSKVTVIKCLSRLEEEHCIKIIKKGKRGMKRNNIYIFLPYKNFEVFSEKFLEANGIDTNEKSYLIAS
jgi:ABC-type phosphate transport system ATPase subunit